MEITGKYSYRNYRLRTLIAIICIIFLVPIQIILFSNIVEMDIYSLSIALSVLIFMVFYYNFTGKRFIEEGQYVFRGNEIEIYMYKNKFVVNLYSIKEISCMKKNIYGQDYILLTINIEGQKKIKIMSDNISKDFDIRESELYSLYSLVQFNEENLKSINYRDSEECFVLKRKNIDT